MSSRRLKVLHVVGARPNFMKVAPVVRLMAARPDRFEQVLVHTGQHYDAQMSDVFFRELGMPQPDFNLEVGSASHAVQTAQIMLRFEPVLEGFAPDWVLVPGDVNSTIACALVAAKAGVRIAHVEAGLRSWDRTMPEEINRVLTDQISDLLLTPSPDAAPNLLREGIAPEKIAFVGNVMIDTVVRLLPQAEARWHDLRRRWPLDEPFVLVTLHRPSNVDSLPRLAGILQALRGLAEDGLRVLFPVHPRTRQRIDGLAGFTPHPRLLLAEPQGYLDFLALQKYAALVLTDSGGIQEETTYLGVPCLTARPNTERPITVTLGTNTLVDSTADAILAAARRKLSATGPARQAPPLWDGHAAERIADALEDAS